MRALPVLALLAAATTAREASGEEHSSGTQMKDKENHSYGLHDSKCTAIGVQSQARR